MLKSLPNDLSLIVYRYIHKNKLQEIHLEYNRVFLSHLNPNYDNDEEPIFSPDSCPDYYNCDNCVIANWRSIRNWNRWDDIKYIFPIYIDKVGCQDPDNTNLYGTGILCPRNYY